MIKQEVIDKVMIDISMNLPVKEIVKRNKVGKTKVYDLIKKFKKNGLQFNSPTHNSVVGVIGDTHFPFVREGYLEFCLDVFIREGVTEVVHIGDIVDFHRWSRHITEPDADSGLSEFDKAKSWIDKMDEMFGKWPITLTLGNHDKIPQRQLKTLGLPPFLLKSFGELFGVSHWDICTSKVIDGVRYKHGVKAAATRRAAERAAMNSVFGHSHSKADIQTTASTERLTWGMHVGCGFDHKAYAARYGEEDELKPIMSCGTVRDGKHPQLHFMDI